MFEKNSLCYQNFLGYSHFNSLNYFSKVCTIYFKRPFYSPLHHLPLSHLPVLHFPLLYFPLSHFPRVTSPHPPLLHFFRVVFPRVTISPYYIPPLSHFPVLNFALLHFPSATFPPYHFSHQSHTSSFHPDQTVGGPFRGRHPCHHRGQ